jgi:hypothetical protein
VAIEEAMNVATNPHDFGLMLEQANVDTRAVVA